MDRLLVKVGLFDDQGDLTLRRGRCSADAGPVSRDDRLVVQVSRWDHLKDMQGVLEGFAAIVAGQTGLRLALVGPEVSAVSDDPEGARVLDECMAHWGNLPPRCGAPYGLSSCRWTTLSSMH